MTDIVDKSTRSRMMAGIRGKDTRAEILVRRALHARGFRYRLNVRGLPGTPDLVFPKRRAVVFIHGCYWHRHEGCRFATTPSSNTDFWTSKFAGNVARDARNVHDLRSAGWRVGIIWECALKYDRGDEAIACLAEFLEKDWHIFEFPKPTETFNAGTKKIECV